QVAIEGMAVCISDGAGSNSPVRDASLVQVGNCPRLTPERSVVDGGRGVHDDLLLEPQPIPSPLGPRRIWRSRDGPSTCWGTGETGAGLGEADPVQPRQEGDGVTARAAPVAVEAGTIGIDVE